MAATRTSVGSLVRHWRQQRRLSQLELATTAGISTRHLSFIETGRANPSREMILQLAAELDVPLRARNELLLAAGFAPAYAERPLDDPQLQGVREAIQGVLAAYDPYPAVVVDRHWDLVAHNRSLGALTAGVAPALLRAPVNYLRLCFSPNGMAPHIVNLAQCRASVLARLAREGATSGNRRLEALRAEIAAFPGGLEPPPTHEIAVPVHLRLPWGELRLLSLVSTFGTATDITLAELSIEAFLPADAATATLLRSLPLASNERALLTG